MAVVAVLDIHIDKNAVLIMNPNINLQQRIQYSLLYNLSMHIA